VIKAVFFDLDGTLCDSGSSWKMGVSASLELFESRFPGRLQEFDAAWQETNSFLLSELASGRMLMRDVIRERYPRTLARIGIDDRAFADTLNDCLSETRLEALRPMPGAHNTLRRLRPDNHLGIITNGSDADYPDSQMATVKRIGVCELVDSIWISDAVGSRKPDSRIFIAALEGAGVRADEAIYVGDSLSHDITGASGAGLMSVLIDPLSEFDGSCAEVIPDHVITSIPEVLQILADLK
jgi:HAD superfamily hydrolase (TIGR01549 family)